MNEWPFVVRICRAEVSPTLSIFVFSLNNKLPGCIQLLFCRTQDKSYDDDDDEKTIFSPSLIKWSNRMTGHTMMTISLSIRMKQERQRVFDDRLIFISSHSQVDFFFTKDAYPIHSFISGPVWVFCFFVCLAITHNTLKKPERTKRVGVVFFSPKHKPKFSTILIVNDDC